MAMSRQKKLDKMDIIELQSEKPKPSFDFKTSSYTGALYLPSQGLADWLWPSLTKPLNLTFERNQKVAIIGANGIGKTTLLKSLLGIIPPIAGEVERGDCLELGYFEQEVKVEIAKLLLRLYGMPFLHLTKQKSVQPLLIVAWQLNISKVRFKSCQVGNKPRFVSVSWWIVKTTF